MRLSRIAAILTVLAASSCMSDMPSNFPGLDGDSGKIEGYVTDKDDNFIEHIKVTFDWDNGSYQEIQYTDSQGYFSSEYWQPLAAKAVTLSVTLEDIDGEDNGGLFEPLRETITVFNNDGQVAMEPIVFRLNRATASENSPQI